MFSKITILILLLLVCTTNDMYLAAKDGPQPLNEREVLALVAGSIVPENIAYDIQSRGIAFVPDESFDTLLKIAGADVKVFTALKAAHVSKPTKPERPEDQAFLKHLSQAGSLIRSGQLDSATNELNNSLSQGSGKFEVGFVMGVILINERRFVEAGRLYSEILAGEENFPEVHARLSLTYFQTGDPESALREAKVALKQNPNNPVAHMNAGLALREMHHFDAAKGEFQESIRSKPDYRLAYANLGILLDDMRDYPGAVAQYTKALALDPGDVNTRYNLGVVYGEQGDHVSAIREYREVKRLDPSHLDVRQNLGSELMDIDPSAAITEFKELRALAPDFSLCHFCLGLAYYKVGRVAEAQQEFRIAIEADPSDAAPHRELGLTLETQNNYDAALAEYRKAQDLDASSSLAFHYAGRLLLLKKDFPAAIAQLKKAEQLNPGDWEPHSLHGQALEASGDRSAAIAEYKESLSLDPKQMQPRVDLALAQEKNGDWIAALNNYRQAAQEQGPVKPAGFTYIRVDAQKRYQEAQERFQIHLTQLRAAGRSADAASMEANWEASKSAPNLDAAYHQAMQDSTSALQQQKFDEAETDAKKAVAIAEKIQPPDARLPESVGQLGSVYGWRRDMKNAAETFKRQLTLSEKIYGPQSPENTAALMNLGMLALQQKDFATAEGYFTHMYDLNQKTFGENSAGAADSLRGLAHVYQMKPDFPKAEETLLRALKIYETIYGPDDNRTAIPWTSLCYVYDRWSKADKSASCHAHLVSMAEKQFGPDSPYMIRDLTAEAQALRILGHTEEAVRLEQRMQTIQAAQSNPN